MFLTLFLFLLILILFTRLISLTSFNVSPIIPFSTFKDCHYLDRNKTILSISNNFQIFPAQSDLPDFTFEGKFELKNCFTLPKFFINWLCSYTFSSQYLHY